jgi:hypothetical protein
MIQVHYMHVWKYHNETPNWIKNPHGVVDMRIKWQLSECIVFSVAMICSTNQVGLGLDLIRVEVIPNEYQWIFWGLGSKK